MQVKYSCHGIQKALLFLLLITGINVETSAMAANWKQIDKLIDEQKLKEAEKAVVKIFDQAKNKDSRDWARSLIKLTKIRIGLNSYETAVKELKSAEWPKSSPDRTLVELYYAQALFAYLQEYSWEIRQRERTVTSDVVDLKAWTVEQIYEEALRTYGSIWSQRSKVETLNIESYKDFLTPNNFPKQIRSTLRDLITYKTVEALQNTAFWRTEDSAQIYRLNLEQLLNGNSGLTDDSAFKNLKNHPIQIITFLLSELKAWHQKKNQHEAALEAGLSLHVALHQLFNEPQDRKKIRTSLATYIEDSKKNPWTARALGELANLMQEQGELIEAHKLAKDCMRDFPAEQAKKCAYLVRYIEQPDLRIISMRNDGLNKRSVLVEHKNLKDVYFRAYKISLSDFLTKSKEQIVPSYTQHQDMLKTKADFSWTQPLPATPDFRTHRTFVIPPFKEKGFYVIIASGAANFRQDNNVIVSTTLNVSDLVTIIDSNIQNHTITVVDGNSGEKVKDAEVKLYRYEYGKNHKLLVSQKTDANGEITYLSDLGKAFFVLVKKDGDITVDENSIYSYGSQLNEKRSETLIYSDRQTYRPKQKIKWKLIAYTNTNGMGDFQIEKRKTIEVYLRDTNRKELAKIIVQTNDFGSASGEFDIPEGSLLGSWHIATNNGHNDRWINVEEYKRPTFEISFQEQSSDIELNKKAVIQANAKYLFGSPVSKGKVVYRISRAPLYARLWGQFLSPVLVTSGEVALKKDGSFAIEFTPEAKKAVTAIDRAKRFTYEIKVDLTDSGGETRSETKRFIGGYALLEIASPETLVCSAGKDCVIEAVLKNLNRIPQEGKSEIKVVSLISPKDTLSQSELPKDDSEIEEEYDQTFKTPGDKLRTRWDSTYNIPSYLRSWQEGNTITTKNLQHNKEGKANFSLTNLPAGAYKINYSGKDRHGNEFSSSSYVMAVASKSDLKIPLLLEFNANEQKAGGEVQIVAHTGFGAKGATLKIFHSGKVIRKISVTPGVNIIDLPITADMRGGIAATLDVIYDFQYYSAKSMLFVPWDNKEVEVSFSSLREQMTPGMEETFTIKVKGSNAKDRAAEILTFMYDKSLDLFGPYNVTAPIFLFPQTLETPRPHINLMARSGGQIASAGFSLQTNFPFYASDILVDIDDYGIGGAGLRRKSRPYSLSESVIARPMAAPTEAQADGARSQESTVEEVVSSAAKSHTKPPTETPQLRENFNETALFVPHLVTDDNGTASVTFKLPDSLTTWHVWAVALMKDFSSGVAHKEVQTAKDLMVRLYTPRLFREGDKVAIQVVVNNTSEKSLSGLVSVRLTDSNDKDIGKLFGLKLSEANFSINAKESSAVTVELEIPPGIGNVNLSSIASSGNISDGEERSIPVLPGRMHLVQSRFIALKDNQPKKLQFPDLLANNDPSLINEKLAVTIDGQLFFSTLKSLPYLVEYPYECTEQTLNRFLAAGIMASLFNKNPNLAKAAATMSQRDTQYEPWTKDDPNKRMLLEETPWLAQSSGDSQNNGHELINLLQKQTAESMRALAFAKLKKYQTTNGGFPWFPGGEPSPYMTLYLMNGFAKAEEFDIPVPQDVIAKGWAYLGAHRKKLWTKPAEADIEYLTFFLYTASSFKDQAMVSKVFSDKDRNEMLNFSFKSWKTQSPYSKLMLSLTLHRSKRVTDAKLVLDSILDSAINDEATGTHWTPEDRSWLWYNDTIETHAFALRALTEMRPKDPIASGLVHWLFMNKKLNQWKSTKATSEVIYSLAKWMGREGTLLKKEEVSVQIGPIKESILFSDDKYEGRKFVQVEASKIVPEMANISLQKQSGALMFANAAWHYSTEKLPTTSSGDFFKIERSYFRRQAAGNEMTLTPLKQGQAVQVGDEIEVQISVKSKHQAEYIHLRDPRPAGFEPDAVTSGHKWDLGLYWYEEVRDNGTNFFFEHIPVGEYTFRYRIRAANAGVFRSMPAEIQSMYAPEFNGFSAGATIEVKR